MLFWKKAPAGLVKTKSSMYSVLVAFWSVMHVLKSTCVSVSTRTASAGTPSGGCGGDDDDDDGLGTRVVLSRSSTVAPRVYLPYSTARRARSSARPLRTASVPIGQSSMSSTRRVFLGVKPNGGMRSCGLLGPRRDSMPFGPSKCGVSLVR